MRMRSIGASILMVALLAAGYGAPVNARQQTGLASLETALQDGEFVQVLEGVPAAERRFGASPRLESLRAQALAALGRYEAALGSVLKYEHMVGDRLPRSHPGHAEMLALKESLQSQFRSELETRKNKLLEERKERAAAAEQVVRQQRTIAEQRTAAGQKQFDERIRLHPRALSDKEAVYLVTTKSGSAHAKADVRALELTAFQSGIFKLHMSQDEFESWLAAQVKEQTGDGKFVKRFIADFHPVSIYGEGELQKDEGGVLVKAIGQLFEFPRYDIAYSHDLNHGFGGRFANDKYGYKKLKENAREIYQVSFEVRKKAQSKALNELVPQAEFCAVSEIIFLQRKAQRIAFECVFPGSQQSLEGVDSEIVRRYGEPTSRNFLRSFKGNGGNHISNYNLNIDAFAWISRIDERDHKGERLRALYLKVYLSSSAWHLNP